MISPVSCYYKIVTASGKETRIAMMDVNLKCPHYVKIKGSIDGLLTQIMNLYMAILVSL